MTSELCFPIRLMCPKLASFSAVAPMTHDKNEQEQKKRENTRFVPKTAVTQQHVVGVAPKTTGSAWKLQVTLLLKLLAVQAFKLPRWEVH